MSVQTNTDKLEFRFEFLQLWVQVSQRLINTDSLYYTTLVNHSLFSCLYSNMRPTSNYFVHLLSCDFMSSWCNFFKYFFHVTTVEFII